MKAPLHFSVYLMLLIGESICLNNYYVNVEIVEESCCCCSQVDNASCTVSPVILNLIKHHEMFSFLPCDCPMSNRGGHFDQSYHTEYSVNTHYRKRNILHSSVCGARTTWLRQRLTT
ncbi:hypothetical protein CHARACLAT_012497 [Characodon lateralis]|uniref:Uncharacterized protein n=1 Tax=Characodon lateralis TaxID=208331 RepID=A0ABU7DTP9_9TELE|nr:hypothetical protein [Characodon lateralis]